MKSRTRSHGWVLLTLVPEKHGKGLPALPGNPAARWLQGPSSAAPPSSSPRTTPGHPRRPSGPPALAASGAKLSVLAASRHGSGTVRTARSPASPPHSSNARKTPPQHPKPGRKETFPQQCKGDIKPASGNLATGEAKATKQSPGQCGCGWGRPAHQGVAASFTAEAHGRFRVQSQ